MANRSYYAKVRSILEQSVIPLLSPTDRLLDIGCGDGLYTELLSQHVGSAEAFDLSKDLIRKARARGLENVTFRVGDATSDINGEFDVVSCIGVLVCVLGEGEFRRALDACADATRPGGILVLRESMNGWARSTHTRGQHPARYRLKADYFEPLHERGLELVHKERVAIWSLLGRRSNWLWVFKQAPTR